MTDHPHGENATEGRETLNKASDMITMEKPEVDASGRYSVNDTCKLLGIARSTLMDWTKRGYIKRSYHKVGYRPFYKGMEIIKCWNMIA